MSLSVLLMVPVVLQSQEPISESSRERQAASTGLSLPIGFKPHMGDLDGMAKRHEIRVLVIPSRSGFFYNAGHPEGIYYEAFDEFQRFVNNRFKTGSLKIDVTFIPVRIDQLEHALLRGVGDIIGFGLLVTPERKRDVLFTTPIDSHVQQVIVRGAKAPLIASLEDLSGKEVYVNPLAAYYESLQRLSASFEKQGKPPILVKAADSNLTDEDLIEMVNAGLVPATVTLNIRAEFWSKVFPSLIVQPEIVLKEEGQLALATRKDSPRLMELLDEFVKGHQLGTVFGNIMVRRYLQSTGWVKESTSADELKKFQTYVDYFKKYAAEYNFDYLMLIAQGYQESGLDQSLRNPSGAVGIMQVIPAYAAAPPISIPDVEAAENNIRAGTKMLRDIVDSYFNDDKLDEKNKMFMAFASYDAGPNRIAEMRMKAMDEGLDPNQWFGNVELVVARDIGQETVQYVNNIYKYYVAYKLVLEQSDVR